MASSKNSTAVAFDFGSHLARFDLNLVATGSAMLDWAGSKIGSAR